MMTFRKIKLPVQRLTPRKRTGYILRTRVTMRLLGMSGRIWNGRLYWTGSLLPSQDMTTHGPAPGANRLGRYLLPFPQKIGSVGSSKQMNLYIIDGHVSRSGERGWLRTDQFLKVPKTQNRWYNLHPAPNPGDNQVVKFWSNDAPHLNSSFSRIAKPSGLMVTPPSRPIAQDTLRKWNKAFHEGTYVCNQAAGFNRCITKLQTDIQDNFRSLEAELTKGKSSQEAEKALTEIQDLTAFC